jgi:hypothetical protein
MINQSNMADRDVRNTRHVVRKDITRYDPNCIFNKETIQMISHKITQLLEGVDKYGKSIIVTDEVIYNVLTNIVDNQQMEVGDIYSRYIIQRNPVNTVNNIINRTVETIVQHIKTEARTIETNESLSIWNSIRGGQNKLGLMPHSKIKLRERRPQTMAFNMNY